jgi:hypothetical protein
MVPRRAFCRATLRDVFRDQEINFIGGIKIVDGGDVGMVELGQREGFLAKSFAGSVVGQVPGGSIFMATWRSSCLSCAKNTTPIPPAPICFSMR